MFMCEQGLSIEIRSMHPAINIGPFTLIGQLTDSLCHIRIHIRIRIRICIHIRIQIQIHILVQIWKHHYVFICFANYLPFSPGYHIPCMWNLSFQMHMSVSSSIKITEPFFCCN